jgi:hypothetical protein
MLVMNWSGHGSDPRDVGNGRNSAIRLRKGSRDRKLIDFDIPNDVVL